MLCDFIAKSLSLLALCLFSEKPDTIQKCFEAVQTSCLINQNITFADPFENLAWH